MRRRYSLGHLILTVVALSLTPLMVAVDAQGQIAFVSSRDGHIRDDVPGIPASEIYVMDANGENQRRLTNNRHHDGSPSWSPAGKRIVFVSHRDGNGEIYVMDADGRNQQNLTNNLAYDSSPSWSPDGKRIAFVSDRKGNLDNFDIYVMDADGGNQQNLTNNRAWNWHPSWSPNGERIAFDSNKDGNTEIYVMNADGGNQQNLTNNRHSDGSPAWLNSPFSVSPAGKKFTLWGWLKQVGR